jgi:hypothetical protein
MDLLVMDQENQRILSAERSLQDSVDSKVWQKSRQLMLRDLLLKPYEGLKKPETILSNVARTLREDVVFVCVQQGAQRDHQGSLSRRTHNADLLKEGLYERWGIQRGVQLSGERLARNHGVLEGAEVQRGARQLGGRRVDRHVF